MSSLNILVKRSRHGRCSGGDRAPGAGRAGLKGEDHGCRAGASRLPTAPVSRLGTVRVRADEGGAVDHGAEPEVRDGDRLRSSGTPSNPVGAKASRWLLNWRTAYRSCSPATNGLTPSESAAGDHCDPPPRHHRDDLLAPQRRGRPRQHPRADSGHVGPAPLSPRALPYCRGLSLVPKAGMDRPGFRPAGSGTAYSPVSVRATTAAILPPAGERHGVVLNAYAFK